MTEGPQLESLTRRLAECPADFLAEPSLRGEGAVRVAAVVSDLLVDWGALPLTPTQALIFDEPEEVKSRNKLSLVLLTCWLVHDSWFLQRPLLAASAYEFLTIGLNALAKLVKASECVSEADRREELVRLCLKALDLHPQGETPAQAQDRFNTLDSIERQRVIRATRQSEARARAIREAMAQKAAQEAADKWTRE
jgi:hypothetical protein